MRAALALRPTRPYVPVLPVLPRLTDTLVRRAPELVAALAGLAWFLAAGGYRAICPSSFEWLVGDASQHVLGWLFFRESRWSLPLGRVDGFVWPVGTTVGFTDSNPLLAIPLKLVSGLLPADFQYVGLWLATCFAFQGWVGARLTGLASKRPWDRFLGGVLFALSPPLLARVNHDTLCAHFCLLALILLHLRPVATPADARRALVGAGTISVLLSMVHPYLAVMAIGLAVALLVKLRIVDGIVSRGMAGRAAAAFLLAPMALLALLGYFTSAPPDQWGFGYYSTDLLALVGSGGASWLLPLLPTAPGQYEGKAYLGLGGIVLSVVAGGLAVARWRPTRRQLEALAPLAAVCALFLVFALSSVVRAGGHEVLDLRWLYDNRLLGALTGPFRSSGRFVWPMYYCVLTGAVLGVLALASRRPTWATGLLAVAVGVQLVDLLPGAFGSRFQPRPWRPQDPAWQLARGRYDHIALVPPQIKDVVGPCRGTIWGDKNPWRPLSYQAYVLGMTVNSGYVARGPAERMARACLELKRDLEKGLVDDRTVYVVHDSALVAFERIGARCGRLDGFTVCVRSAPDEPFAAALASPG